MVNFIAIYSMCSLCHNLSFKEVSKTRQYDPIKPGSINCNANSITMRGSRGGGGGRGSGYPLPWKITKAIGFLSNTSPDSLEIHKVTKPEFNDEPASGVAGGPMMARF